MPGVDNWPLSLVELKRLVAIIRLDDLSQAVNISRTLLLGGIAVQEFTLTNPSAIEAIARVRREIADFSSGHTAVGVGSVRSVEQAQAAISAGAQFVVTPTTNTEIIRYCVEQKVCVMPGAMTPTEILTAWMAGADVVKIFPARTLGPTYIGDVLAPLPELRLMPTGGVDLQNMQGYFEAGAFAVGVGGKLLDKQAIAAGDWSRVQSTASEYACAALSINGDR
jgi:2-dehydro-3-deoxyphosphogluconate aldolase / (4S)-4-hydroxy-2-oxoglutarate aldolase